jgi:hypothetical protein
VCVLRERGHNEAAERLRADELMPLLAAVRLPTDDDAAITERLNSLFATEGERVANAAVLAEMVGPMIADQLRPLATVQAPAAASAPVVASLIPAAKPAQLRPASIADFIDDMIAQEKPPERPGQGAQRRAS